MTDLVVLIDDGYEDCIAVMYPSEEFMQDAKEGTLPHIKYYWKLRDAELRAIKEGTHDTFEHNQEDLANLLWAREHDNVGPLTEEQALEYLILKDLQDNVWGNYHNSRKFRIVHKDHIPKDRVFRNAWKMKQ